MHMYKILMLLLLAFSAFPSFSDATRIYSFGKEEMIIGSLKTHETKGGESLIELARRFGIGYNEIVDVNPGIDPFVPGDGKTVHIPSAWILPDIPEYDGIVINLSEMRMYYFSKKSDSIVRTFPIGIGDEGTETPVGNFKIVEKIANPSWHVPESIKKERPELPSVVPPGPENPLGTHALRLSERSVLIHGTNRPYAVGRRASHGCIRMYPEDIPKLFQAVPNGTKVTILHQPVKVGTADGKVYLEVHKDRTLHVNYFDEAVTALRKKNLYDKIDRDKMLVTLREKRGIPVDISAEK